VKFQNTNRSMNEHFIIQLSEQLDSIVGRAKFMALPLTVADALPFIANRGQTVFGFDDATKTDFEDLSRIHAVGIKNHEDWLVKAG